MLSSAPLTPLTEDGYIETYNLRLEGFDCMKEYHNAHSNGSLTSGGPPLPRLKVVPQALYMGNRKYPDIHSTICTPIEFWVIKPSDSETLILKGLKLTDAIEGNPEGLCRASQRAPLGRSTRTSIRLRVNGYADHGEQILPSTKETVGLQGRKLVEVAEMVAAIVKRNMPLVDVGVVEIHQWRLPDGDTVTFEDLMLLELRRVTTGSWQPVLAYADPISR